MDQDFVWVWQHGPVNQSFRKLRQEDGEVQAYLGYVANNTGILKLLAGDPLSLNIGKPKLQRFL